MTCRRRGFSRRPARGPARGGAAGFRAAAASVLALGLAAACAGAPDDAARQDAPDDIARRDGLFAEIHTNRGLITLRLEPERAPLATASFVGLAEGTIENDAFGLGRPFYDGSPFHRVVPGHVIQAGRPVSDAADGPGYTYPNEIHADLSHDRAGVLGVANGGPHTNGAQFYITLGDRSYLDGDYIVLGEVVDGLDVVMSIVQDDDRVDSVRIVRRGDANLAFRPDTESFRARVRTAEARVAEVDRERRRAEEAWLARHLPGLEGDPDGVRTVPALTTLAAAAAPAPVGVGGSAAVSPALPANPARALRVRYRGTALRFMGHLIGYQGPPIVEMAFGSDGEGAPGFHDPPVVFTFEPGATTINPGLDDVLARMVPGQRVTAVVPAALAYGTSGRYAPERPGEPRFVISPNTMLVYEIEVLDGGQR